MNKSAKMALLSGMSILLLACKPEKISPTGTPTGKESASDEKSISIPNYDYFDFIGKVHNDAVKIALESSTYSGLSNAGKLSFFMTTSSSLYPAYGITPANTSTPADIDPIIAEWNAYTVKANYELVLSKLTADERQVITTMAGINENPDLNIRASKTKQLKIDVFNSVKFTDDQKAFLLSSISLIYESQRFWEQNPGSAGAIGGGVWKADWKGFWYGWNMNTSHGTLNEHWENATGTAELASEMQRMLDV